MHLSAEKRKKFDFYRTVLPSVLAAAGGIPLFHAALFHGDPERILFACVSFTGWLLAALLVVVWRTVEERIRQSAGRLQIEIGEAVADDLIRRYTREVERRSESILNSMVEQRMASKEELSRTLEKVVALSFRLLRAESVELALFDRESGAYHSSFVLGKPFRKTAQMMLSEGNGEGDVVISPINFAGVVLGSLRSALKNGRTPTAGDRQIMNLLALQSSMAVINTEFTGELLRMRRVSDESVKAKTGFLANLSHEIRGPLSIMMNAVELVLEGMCGEVTDDQKDTLLMVKTNGRHLLDLINDVLDYAKAESGRVTINPVPLPVDEILNDLRKVISVQAEAKSHRITCRMLGKDAGILCDRRHARQILINLLTNAVKYTPDGGTIEMWAERIPGNRIKINVKDSGVGIQKQNRDKVFAAFERIEDEYSSRQVGTGLGMSLTRRLVELNGGTIDFSSEPGRGSVFWIILPSSEVSEQKEDLKTHVEAEVDGKGKTVLILSEDSQETRTIARYLARLRFTLAYASNSLEAVESLKLADIDVVIIDNSAQDIEQGTERELVSRLRENVRNRKLPIVLLSSRAFSFDVEKYLKAGVDKCLAKPVELQELARTCCELGGTDRTGY